MVSIREAALARLETAENDAHSVDMKEEDEAARGVWFCLTSVHRETLAQLLYQGPVWDGNIVSKSHRDDLMEWGLATRCCYMGETGYATATYRGCAVFKQGGGIPIEAKAGRRG